MERIGMVPGTEVGGYHLLTPLGHGGMGSVYRAVDGAGTVVALKLVHPHLAADPNARERLRREVATLQRIRHPGVARVLDAEIESTEAFVVTELVEGEDVAARVLRRGPLPPGELAMLADRLRVALEVVHDAGVLHRDLTPGNVVLTPRGPVLIDFGIAQAADEARVTSTGLVVGTPGYLSPELLEGGEPSAAGDWWGWAALLAFAATGRPPFGSRPLQMVLARVRAGDVDLDGLDRRTAQALASALTVDPARRVSPGRVAAELERAAAGDTEPEPRTAAPAGSDAPTMITAVPAAEGWTHRTAALPAATGATAVLPLPVGAPAAVPGHHPHDHDDHDDHDGYDGYDEKSPYDGAVDDGVPDDGSADDEPWGSRGPRRPPRRTGTVLAVGLLLLALGVLRPGVALAAAVACAVMVRSVGLDVEAIGERRARRGPRRADVPVSVLAWPWYLLRGVVGVLPAAVVGASLVLVLGGVGWWLLDAGWVVVPAAPEQVAGELAGNPAWVVRALVGGAVLLGLLAVWFGPMSRSTRWGARWVLAAVAPGRTGAAVVTVIALAAAAVLAWSARDPTATTVWWPLPGPPDLR